MIGIRCCRQVIRTLKGQSTLPVLPEGLALTANAPASGPPEMGVSPTSTADITGQRLVLHTSAFAKPVVPGLPGNLTWKKPMSSRRTSTGWPEQLNEFSMKGADVVYVLGKLGASPLIVA